jgi:hypothetical protein
MQDQDRGILIEITLEGSNVSVTKTIQGVNAVEILGLCDIIIAELQEKKEEILSCKKPEDTTVEEINNSEDN